MHCSALCACCPVLLHVALVCFTSNECHFFSPARLLSKQQIPGAFFCLVSCQSGDKLLAMVCVIDCV